MTLTLPTSTSPQSVTAGAAFTWDIMTGAELAPAPAPYGALFDAVFVHIQNANGTSDPTLEFSGDGGTAWVSISAPSTSVDVPTSTGGDANVTEWSPGVWMILVRNTEAAKPTISFRITDTHVGDPTSSPLTDDPTAMTYVYVGFAAGSELDAQRPWQHINPTQDSLAPGGPGTLVNGVPKETAITIWSLGTGPLTLAEVSDPTLGTSGYQVVDPAELVIDAGASAERIISYAAIAPGEEPLSWPMIGDDPDASPGALGRNDTVSMTSRAGEIELVLVLDASGSMTWNWSGANTGPGEDSKWELLDLAVDLCLTALGQIAEGSGQLSVITFPDQSSPIDSDTNVTWLRKAAISASPYDDLLATDYAAITGGGGTALADAMLEGIGTNSANADDYGLFEPSQVAVDYNYRFMLAMTDGMNNRGTQLDEFIDGGTKDNWFSDKKVSFLAVPMGPRENGSSIDHEILDAIAQDTIDESQGTTGELLWADNANFFDAGDIQDAFKRALATVADLDLADPSAVLTGATPALTQAIEVTAYDREVTILLRWANDKSDVVLSLTKPDGTVLDESALASIATIKFHHRRRLKAVTIKWPFFGKTQDPNNENWGVWSLRIHCREFAREVEPVAWDVLIKGGLRLQLDARAQTALAGAPIDVSARLTAQGKPVPGASVKLYFERPTNNLFNLIALNTPSAEAWGQARKEFADRDAVSRVAIKQRALEIDGYVFEQQTDKDAILLVDEHQNGVYTASAGSAKVAGSYHAYVVATGLTANGRGFRREGKTDIVVPVVPSADHSSLWADWGGDPPTMQITFFFRPVDQFGNILMFDPLLADRVVFEASVGSWTGPVDTKFDGVYFQTLEYKQGAKPVINVIVDGHRIIKHHEVPDRRCIIWAKEVARVDRGREAQPGANKYAKPEVLLGEPSFRGGCGVYATGASGSVEVSMGRGYVRASHVVVRTADPEDRRAYRVEVLALVDPLLITPRVRLASKLLDRRPRWVCVGSSRGGANSFPIDLRRAPRILAVRVTDESGQVYTDDKIISCAPGVAIAGIGVVDQNCRKLGRPTRIVRVIRKLVIQ